LGKRPAVFPDGSRTHPFRPAFLAPRPRRHSGGRAWIRVGSGLALVGPARLIAQIEGDRGIIPVASTSDIEVVGIEVNATGSNAEEARLNGWQEAARKAWSKAGGPSMSDGQIQSMVSAVVIEREQIGPRRYVATVSIVFDRARAGQYIGGKTTGGKARSSPLLVIPVLHSGGVSQVFEIKGRGSAPGPSSAPPAARSTMSAPPAAGAIRC
jgi:hypothetical protein